MQIRHAKPGDEAQLAALLEDHERHYGASTRSAGVGEKLIEAIRALARSRGDTRVLWTTGEDNPGAQRFYDRLGMRREKKVYSVMDV
jgi:GNAT superfamily N-acetyltransferase